MTAKIDVIVPVYNGLDLVKGCIESLWMDKCVTPYELIVIDDASTDLSIRPYLQQCAETGRLTLLVNEENLGFTGTVNRGMALHPDRDVLLLNSDTVVYGNWLDRLRAAAYSDEKVACSNPMTNANGSHISCYPSYAPGGWQAIEVNDGLLDEISAEVNPHNYVYVHAVVGFCMFIKREALLDIGLFDIENFPIGYGEETDFCFRAVKMGWHHVVTGDTFVTHLEGKSFGDKKKRLMEEMFSRFQRLHPEAVGRDQRFAELDPIRSIRIRLDLGRLRRLLEGKNSIPAYLSSRLVVHNSDRELLSLTYDASSRTFTLAPKDPAAFPNLVPFNLPYDLDVFNHTLRFLGISTIRVSSEIDREIINQGVAGLPFEEGLKAGLVIY